MVNCWTFIGKEANGGWSATCHSDAELTPEAVEAGSKYELERKLRDLVVEKSGKSHFSVVTPQVTPKTALFVFSIGVAAPAGAVAAAPAAGGAPAAAAAKAPEPEPEPEEEEEDMGFDLFG